MAKWLQHRDQVASAFQQCLGGLPAWGELEARVVQRVETLEYVAEWVRFNAEPGEVVAGLLVRPAVAPGPLPVVLAHHGFWDNKDLLLLGEDADGPGDGKVPLWQLIRFGLAVMAIDGRGHGERSPRDFVLPWRFGGKGAVPRPNRVLDREGYRRAVWEDCEWLNRAALVQGYSLATFDTWDAIRALDYLAGRPDVDAGRVGCFGHSRGGGVAWYTALVDQRVRAVCTSGCMMTFEACLRFRRDAGWSAWIPGIRRYASREELISALAPRPLLALEGEEDHPREGEQPIWDTATQAYALLGVPERFAGEHWPGAHGELLRDPAALRRIGEWFSRWLAVDG